MDTLSEVLRAVRLTGAIYFTIDASAPWVAEAPNGATIAPHLMGGVEHVMEYHLVISGGCWAGIVGERPVRLEAGDVIVLPHGDAHVLASEPGMRGTPDPSVFLEARRSPVPLCLSLEGGGPERTEVVCGFLGCDARPFNPLLAALPRVLHLRASGERGGALRRLVELALAESSAAQPGGASVLARLSELLFIEVVRRWLSELPADEVGWVAGLRDGLVSRALEQLHAEPARDWTLATLGKAVGASRSVLAERFTHFVGVPPMQYLAQWRVQVAASMLRSSRASLAEIAEQVGYGSEGALSRAFKRAVGVPPATYRGRTVTNDGRSAMGARASAL